MEQNKRIICDCYAKKEKKLLGDDPNTPFNQKIVSVNNMYGWLYKEGILEKVAFELKDYSDCTYFAFDVAALLPFREKMKESGVEGSALAIDYIFDCGHSPCEYCGAITLGYLMQTYRDFDGTVSRGWECLLCEGLASHAVLDVYQVKEEKGIKEAVKAAFDFANFKPSDL